MKVMKIFLIGLYLFVGLFILYLSNTKNKIDERIEESTEAIKDVETVVLQDIIVATGQEIYVPAYSNIKSVEGKGNIPLSINLSVRNTDPDHSIILSYVDFYNTSGHMSKRFLSSPRQIGPMATTSFHIAQSDTIGGIGANFYLKWVSETLVNEPVVEAIMIGSSGNQGFSWISKGLVVKRAMIE